ncbi:MAG: hypothetical protein M3O02_09955 [Acidobacteriota bacterium]|nr:hypothetical protein [Acidobacteriota bacterium]
MDKRYLLPFVLLLLLPAVLRPALAQQLQTTTAPVAAINAKYVNGMSPGYWVTPGVGLHVRVSSGSVFCNGTMVPYAGGALAISASGSTYIYLNTASGCVPATKSAPFSGSDIPIATVTANSTAVTGVLDGRTMFRYDTPASGSGSANFASPPGLGTTIANQVFATSLVSTSQYLSGSPSTCTNFGRPGGLACSIVNVNDSAWARDDSGSTGHAIFLTQLGPGVGDAGDHARTAVGYSVNSIFASASITNDLYVNSSKVATGDYLPLNINAYGRSGVSEHSDQGYNGLFLSGGSPVSYPRWTIATGGTGSQAPTFTGSPTGCYTGSGGGDACKRMMAGGFLLDVTDAPITTNLVGPSGPFSPGCATWLRVLPVTPGSLPVTTAWGCATAVNLNPHTNPNAPVAQTFTISTGSGTFAAGDHVTVGGSEHYEQTTITSVSGSAGSQTVTLPLAYANGNISIWKGGPEGRFLSEDAIYAASSGQHRTTWPVVGALDSSHLIYLFPSYGENSGDIPTGAGGDPETTDGGPDSAVTLFVGARISNLLSFEMPPQIQLEPNLGTWVPGQITEQPDFPSQNHVGLWSITNMNAQSTGAASLTGVFSYIGGYGSSGPAQAYEAENGFSNCFLSGACGGKHFLPARAAYGIGLRGPYGYFRNHMEASIMPQNAIVKVGQWNTGQTCVNVFDLPDSLLNYCGIGSANPYQWRFDNNGGGSIRAAYFQFDKRGGMNLGMINVYPFADAALGSLDPSRGSVAPDGNLHLNTLYSNTTSSTLYQGPATAPTGSCSTVGWAFSQDGHASFCNGTSWAVKI